MRYIFSFIISLIVILPRASAGEDPLHGRPISLEVLTFHNSKNYHDLHAIHFEPRGDGMFHPAVRVPMSMTISVEVTDSRNRVTELGKMLGALTYLSLNGLLKTRARHSIDDATLMTEFERRYPDPSQVQYVSLGTWVTLREWYALATRPEVSGDMSKHPFSTYSRSSAADQKDIEIPSLIELAQLSQNEGIWDQVERHIIRAGLLLVSSQVRSSLEDSKRGRPFKRVKAGWEDHVALTHDFKLEDDMLAWELSRAGQTQPGLFSKLLPVVTTIAVNEAQLYGVPLDRAFLIAHAPDAAHARLYQNAFGFEPLASKQQADRREHALLRLSLAKALELPMYRTRQVSQKVSELVDISSGRVNEVAAFNFLRVVKQYIRSHLDVDIRGATQDEPIQVIDRSIAFYKGTKAFIEAMGFDETGYDQITKMLSTFSGVNYGAIKLSDVNFMPEQLDTGVEHPLYHSMAVFNLPAKALDEDEPYLEDLLVELYSWARQRASFYPTQQFNQEFILTVFTKRENLRDQLVNMGGTFNPVKYRAATIDIKKWTGMLVDAMESVHAISFSGRHLAHLQQRNASKMKTVRVKMGYFERQEALCSTLFH